MSTYCGLWLIGSYTVHIYTLLQICNTLYLNCSVFPLFQSVLPWAECPINANMTGPIEECEKATSTQYFFYRETLNISSSIEVNGGVHMGQALCFLLAWLMTYLFIVKGVKSTGKVRVNLMIKLLHPYFCLILALNLHLLSQATSYKT